MIPSNTSLDSTPASNTDSIQNLIITRKQELERTEYVNMKGIYDGTAGKRTISCALNRSASAPRTSICIDMQLNVKNKTHFTVNISLQKMRLYHLIKF